MKFLRIAGLAGAIGAVALSPAVHAQSLAGAVGPSATDTEVHAQGARVPVKRDKTRKVDVTVGALVTYDTNVTRSSDTVAAQNNLKPEDVFFAPVVVADVSLPFGPADAYLNGSASYLIYGRNSRLNGEHLAGNGGVSSQFGKCLASIDGSLSRQRTNVVDLAAQSVGVRNFETISSIGVTGGCGATVGLQPFAQFNYSRGTNTNERRKGSDYRTLTYGAGVSYVQPSIGEIGIIGSIQDTDYTERDGSIGTILSGVRSFPTRSIGAYYTRDVTRFFTARVRVNYTDVATRNGSSYEGITGEASVKVSPTPRFSVTASAYRMVMPSLTFSIDYSVETGAGLSANFNLTRKLTAILGYAYVHQRYTSTATNLLYPLGWDDDHLVNGELNYALNRRIVLTLGAAYETRHANSSYYDFDSFRLIGGLRGAF